MICETTKTITMSFVTQLCPILTRKQCNNSHFLSHAMLGSWLGISPYSGIRTAMETRSCWLHAIENTSHTSHTLLLPSAAVDNCPQQVIRLVARERVSGGGTAGESSRNSGITKLSTGMAISGQALSLCHHRILCDTISTNHENTERIQPRHFLEPSASGGKKRNTSTESKTVLCAPHMSAFQDMHLAYVGFILKLLLQRSCFAGMADITFWLFHWFCIC
jgi:hypothetical protein